MLKINQSMPSDDPEMDMSLGSQKVYFKTTDSGYSDFWRRNKTSGEVGELAKILTAIRTIATYVGHNTGSIVWEGMSASGSDVILDPTLILGSYPVPGNKTDIIIGLAVRKCFHKTEFSARLIKLATNRIHLSDLYMYKFHQFIRMAENVYTDCLANRSALGFYTEAARLWQIKSMRSTFITPPTFVELLYIWWSMAAHRSGTRYLDPFRDRSAGGLTERTSLEKFYTTPLRHLNELVAPLMHEDKRIHSKIERVENRLNLYLSIWPKVLEFIRFWPGDLEDSFLLGDRYAEEMAAEALLESAMSAAVRRPMLHVENHLRGPRGNFTEDVRRAINNDKDVVGVEFDDITTLAKDKIDLNLLWRIKRVLYSLSSRKTTKIRGLRAGKIDRRRLFRAATTGTVFHLKKSGFILNHDVVLLIDCSGSMDSPRKLARCETLYQTLFTAIKEVNNAVRLYGYNELRDTCRITELHCGDRFHNILPHGKTASGEAIIAIGIRVLARYSRSPVILHITDGAANWGCGVGSALRFCRRNNIRLLTLGLECHAGDRHDLKKEYSNGVQFVDQLHEVPSILEQLLRSLKRQ